MKFLNPILKTISLTSITITLIHAGLTEMESSFQKLTKNSDINIQNKTLTEIVTQYGCWCSSVAFNHKTDPEKIFSTNLVQNKPIDEIDNACKVLMDSYDCTILDEECKYPNKTSYNIGEVFSKISCKKLENACERSVCAIEQHFVSTIVQMMKRGKFMYQDDFIHEKECQPEYRKVLSRKCWGAFPRRFPYEVQKHLAMAYIGGI